MSLTDLRSSLEKINIELIQMLIDRRDLVSQIQHIKKLENANHFDPGQEWIVFSNLSNDLNEWSLEEILAFSLIMQSHVGKESNYPRWSTGEHLVKKSDNIIDQINPILLAKLKPELVESLEFNNSFKFVKKFIDSKILD